MNGTNQQTPSQEPNKSSEAERTKHVTAVAWTAGVFAVVAGCTLINAPTWPVSFGIAAVAMMVAFICGCILKRG
jgi:hypothetical protein